MSRVPAVPRVVLRSWGPLTRCPAQEAPSGQLAWERDPEVGTGKPSLLSSGLANIGGQSKKRKYMPQLPPTVEGAVEAGFLNTMRKVHPGSRKLSFLDEVEFSF